MDTKILEEIGFTRGEVKAYMALIELGESSIGPISKKAEITPSKTYPILEKLKNKGLVTYVIKSGTKYFQILNPKRIVDFLQEKEKKITEQKKEIVELIPHLISHQKQEAEQYATIYEGFEGIKTLYSEIMQYLSEKKEEFICFSLGDEYKNREANIFFKIQDRKRFELGLKTKIIALKSQKKFLLKEHGDKPWVEYRFLKQSVPTGVIIYGNNVVNLLWHKKPTAFVVHSKENAKVYRKFFEDFWKTAKE